MTDEKSMEATPIDVVVAWVDGHDPAHRAKREKYQSGANELSRNDLGGEDRFNSCNEIVYCIGSILRHAPFVRHIHIITDGQTPPIQEMIARNFPERAADVHIVDHKEIFKGYEEYLPTFNSLSIETMMWRIPGLSEKFVYFNDDFMLASDIEPSDWFDPQGRPICYAKWTPSFFAHLLRRIKPKKNGVKPFGFKDSMVNATDLVGMHRFPMIAHTPYPLSRRAYEVIYEKHPHLMEVNIRHKFRDEEQYNPQVLTYALGNYEMRSSDSCTLFLQPRNSKPGYITRKLRDAARMGDSLKFVCVNTMHRVAPEEQTMLHEWLLQKAGITI